MDRLNLNKSVVASVSVALEVTGGFCQQLLWAGSISVGREVINGIPVFVVAKVVPEASQSRCDNRVVDQFEASVVGVNDLGFIGKNLIESSVFPRPLLPLTA